MATAGRSIFLSTSVRNAAARVASQSKASRSPLPIPTRNSISHRIFRCPVEMSACLESMQPFHTATASALLTSMLTLSRNGYGWLPEGNISIPSLKLATMMHEIFPAHGTQEIVDMKCLKDLMSDELG